MIELSGGVSTMSFRGRPQTDEKSFCMSRNFENPILSY